MPGMNGRELANSFLRCGPRCECSTCRATPRMRLATTARWTQGITLLQKPFTLPALKAKVREVLDTPLPQEVSMSAR